MAKPNHVSQKKQNPAIAKAKMAAEIEKKLNDAHYDGIFYSSTAMKLLSYMVLSDKFGFTNEQLETYREKMDDLADSILGKYLSVKDILTACREEFKLNLSDEDILRIDPGFGRYINYSTDDSPSSAE